jgi:uncharacterized membrane protein YoaT (DUF817 family)
VSEEARLPSETLARRLLWALQRRMERSRAGRWLFEVLIFALKQAWACLFGIVLLAVLFVTGQAWPADLPVARYDFLLGAALLIQAAMLLFRLETVEEAKVIFVFHVVGTVMELFKTYAGSWLYPDPGVLRIGAVPLFAGFMYASVGSYIARVWRIFDLEFTGYPPAWTTWLLAAGVYVNFFSHHWTIDFRVLLFAATGLLFWRSWLYFTTDRVQRRIPLLLVFAMVGVMIWVAENLGTYSRVWIYPHQRDAWHMVSPQKIGSWFLLMIISFVLVSLVHRPRDKEKAAAAEAATA